MPIYAYRCRSCGHELEELQPMGAPAPGPCPVCAGELRKVYGRVAVTFSGWGFATTDSLIAGDRRTKDFKALRSKAEEISER
jgi:putative FmdB family regulatory protein